MQAIEDFKRIDIKDGQRRWGVFRGIGMRDSLQLLEDLSNAPGVSGFERDIQDILREELTKLNTEIVTDNLGSIIAKDGDKGPKILVAGHMDEIGFMVRLITKEGFIRFSALGGWWDQVLLSQRVVVYGRKGPVIGVIGSKPPHILSKEERQKPVEKNDMFIDVGAFSAEEVEELGIRPGDPIVPVSPFTCMGNEDMYIGKALDNRVGCAIAVETLKLQKNEGHPNQLYVVGTVQEEVGLRGAQTAGTLVDPDIALAFEVAIAGDTPGVDENKAQAKLGKGPVIFILDRSLIPNLKLRDLAFETAEELDINYQVDIMEGGSTDAGKLSLVHRGVPSLCIGVPVRYIHSHTGVVNIQDYYKAIELTSAIVSKLDAETVASIKKVW